MPHVVCEAHAFRSVALFQLLGYEPALQSSQLPLLVEVWPYFPWPVPHVVCEAHVFRSAALFQLLGYEPALQFAQLPLFVEV